MKYLDMQENIRFALFSSSVNDGVYTILKALYCVI